MDFKIMVMILIFGVLIFLMLYVMGLANRIIFYRDKVKDKFSGIKDAINKRVEIIDIVINFIEVNCSHEDNIMKKFKNIKKKFIEEKDINKSINLIYKSRDLFNDFFNLKTVYITFSANNEFMKIENMVIDNDSKLVFSASTYNECAYDYNKYISKKGISTVAKLLRFNEFKKYE